VISAEGSAIEIRVIATDEEGVIARSTRAALTARAREASQT
jgi:acetate kinase